MKETNKVLVIGLDGATFDLIIPWIKQGKLPNIASFLQEGCYGELESTIPPLSPVAWTSFATGVSPDKHGIYDFFLKDKTDFNIEFCHSKMRLVKPFWELAGQLGKKVCIIDVPASFPADTVNGCMISGEPYSSNKERFFPQGLYFELTKKFGMDFLKVINPEKGIDLEGCLNLLERKYHVIDYLLGKTDYDIITVVFTITDVIQHFMWHTIDERHPKYRTASPEKGKIISKVYQKLDDVIGDFLHNLRDNYNIIILSDHGFGPLYEKKSLSDWLVKNGYLFFTNKNNANKTGSFLRFFTRRFMKKTERITSGFKEAINEIDWSKTRVYFSGSAGGIYINLRGREPYGIVEQGHGYESLKESLILKLKEMRSEINGEKIIKEIYQSEHLYPESVVKNLPDLFILCNKGFDILNEVVPTKRFVKNPMQQWSGTHVLDGIFMAKGPSIEEGKKIKKAKIIDVAPTIYYLADIPLPRGMDGGIISSAIRKEYLAKRPPMYSNMLVQKEGGEYGIFTQDEFKAVEDRLKGLGYIE